MLQTSDQPTLREVLPGWHLVRTGKTRSGDKYWWSTGRAWLPVGRLDRTLGADVRAMPVVIRKER